MPGKKEEQTYQPNIIESALERPTPFTPRKSSLQRNRAAQVLLVIRRPSATSANEPGIRGQLLYFFNIKPMSIFRQLTHLVRRNITAITTAGTTTTFRHENLQREQAK
ncbi:MAG: hypothetical protein QCI38_08080 [Candidatus Thermoplasmatota archaeon]|nr:hypothetical protein [Candidatus Thermoplasmatota archaeon]